MESRPRLLPTFCSLPLLQSLFRHQCPSCVDYNLHSDPRLEAFPLHVSPLEIGWNKGIRKLWLECDSVIAVQMIEQEVPSDHPLSNILISEKRSKAGYLKTGEYWRTLVLSRYELIFKVPLCNLEVVKGWCWDAFDVGVHVLRSIAVPLDGVSGVFCGGPGVA
ncbi:hypothetical protein E2542_SST13972 [Spatholobus suberectus]|nr:hypothetical protein E2542_SST13972 [Spatholobus suberectus]